MSGLPPEKNNPARNVMPTRPGQRKLLYNDIWELLLVMCFASFQKKISHQAFRCLTRRKQRLSIANTQGEVSIVFSDIIFVISDIKY